MFSTRRRFLRDNPTDPGNGPNGGGGAPANPPANPPAPPAFDPASLTPEARAWLDAQVSAARTDERGKSRNYDKANAAKEAREQLLRELTGGGEQRTPEQIREALAAAESTSAAKDARINTLLTEREIGAVCRSAEVGADGELVAAVLAQRGKLEGLDPAAADFGAKVKALVLEAVAANPRLKLDVTPAPPAPGGSGPAAPHNAPRGGEPPARKAGSMQEALANALNR